MARPMPVLAPVTRNVRTRDRAPSGAYRRGWRRRPAGRQTSGAQLQHTPADPDARRSGAGPDPARADANAAAARPEVRGRTRARRRRRPDRRRCRRIRIRRRSETDRRSAASFRAAADRVQEFAACCRYCRMRSIAAGRRALAIAAAAIACCALVVAAASAAITLSNWDSQAATGRQRPSHGERRSLVPGLDVAVGRPGQRRDDALRRASSGSRPRGAGARAVRTPSFGLRRMLITQLGSATSPLTCIGGRRRGAAPPPTSARKWSLGTSACATTTPPGPTQLELFPMTDHTRRGGLVARRCSGSGLGRDLRAGDARHVRAARADDANARC